MTLSDHCGYSLDNSQRKEYRLSYCPVFGIRTLAYLYLSNSAYVNFFI